MCTGPSSMACCLAGCSIVSATGRLLLHVRKVALASNPERGKAAILGQQPRVQLMSPCCRTAAIAAQHADQVITAGRGRARQMNAGAHAATGRSALQIGLTKALSQSLNRAECYSTFHAAVPESCSDPQCCVTPICGLHELPALCCCLFSCQMGP